MTNIQTNTQNTFFLPNELYRDAQSILYDRYNLSEIQIETLGGIFCHAYDKLEERDLTLKIFPHLISEDNKCIEILRKETKRSLNLSHSNIWRIYSLEIEKNLPFLRMELLPTKTLQNLIGTNPNLKIVKKILRQSIQALSYAYERNILHGDVRPSAIAVDEKYNVKLIDFGIAKIVTDTMTRITGVKPVGANLYSAPEIIKGKFYGKSSEFYSLACVIYELLTESPPFSTGNLEYQHINEEPEELPESIEKKDSFVHQFVSLGLTKDAEKRLENINRIINEPEEKIPQNRNKIYISNFVRKYKPKNKIKFALTIFSLMIVVSCLGILIIHLVQNYQNQDYLENINISKDFWPVSGNKFGMGIKSEDQNIDNPYTEVKITNTYYIGKFEISRKQFLVYINAKNNDFTINPNYKWLEKKKGEFYIKTGENESYPATGMEWKEACNFCNWLSEIDNDYDYQLPTEAEWELAARGVGNQKFYPWGNELVHENLNSNSDDLCIVGLHRQNDNEVYNIVGNAAEWVWDFYDKNYYHSFSSLEKDPQGPDSGHEHVIRGGSFRDQPEICGVAIRKKTTDYKNKMDGIGFRIVRVDERKQQCLD